MGSRQAQSHVLVVLGPTASGKTSVAIEFARLADGEVISADSRAFFTGLDIVTDKPTREERQGVRHHLIDHVPIDGSYDAMAFRSDVSRLLPEIRSRGHQPVVAGGGTLYLAAILRGIFEGTIKDEALRASMNARALEELYRELERLDSSAAARIHPNDRLRIARALEVYHTTGKTMTQWQSEAKPLPESFHVVGLHRDRASHRLLIESRIRQMLESGLIEEIAALRTQGLTRDVQAYRTIGVPEAFEVLDGTLTREEFVQAVSARTWQLARRQMAWFRRDKAVHWIDATTRTAASIAREICTAFPVGRAENDEVEQ